MSRRRRDQHRGRDGQERQAGKNPELLPRDQAMDHRADGELPRGAAKHAEALREPDRGREPGGGEPMAGEIDGAGECERRPGALQQAAGFRAARRAEAEHDCADRR